MDGMNNMTAPCIHCGFDPSPSGWVGFSGRCEYVHVRFGLDILSRTPAEPHPAKRRLTLCPRRIEAAALPHNKSAMSSRSWRNSFSVAVIMARLKSLMA
ncbi:MAG: hypothetical protein OXE80_03880, partial [Gammaproteobacteria bacterium]|nr:hypothetical protein [Gammaproteobacteria bacterium]